jgi:hypothetical protein
MKGFAMTAVLTTARRALDALRDAYADADAGARAIAHADATGDLRPLEQMFAYAGARRARRQQ